MDDGVRMSLEEVGREARAILNAYGFSDDHADAIADTMVAAERDGCHHHGLFRLPFYVKAVTVGRAATTAEPTLSELAPGVIAMDAHLAFAPLALQRAHAPLVARARSQGLAALALKNAHNVAALWPEVERLAEAGLVAFAFTSAMPYVAPHGGVKPLFGTNPMAFAWPRRDAPPLVFDMATSACARGEIQIRLRDGRTLEEGWAIDAQGQPTTDPQTALEGAQLPFGGAKGALLSMMVELLAGPLIGDVLSVEAGEADTARSGAPCGGELILAIDPTRMMWEGDLDRQAAHAERLFALMLQQEGVRLPSDRRYQARTRALQEGVVIAPALHETLQALKAAA